MELSPYQKRILNNLLLCSPLAMTKIIMPSYGGTIARKSALNELEALGLVKSYSVSSGSEYFADCRISNSSKRRVKVYRITEDGVRNASRMDCLPFIAK